jgi:ABC-type multidrug transport system ATPase subunit
MKRSRRDDMRAVYPKLFNLASVSVPGSGDGGFVLEARQLRKSYGDRVALADVSFDARRGELVACIGPNGAGKTTLLSILAEIKQPDSGSIQYTGGKVGWVPQDPALYRKLSVRENLRLFARLDGVDDIDGTVDRMLAQTELE